METRTYTEGAAGPDETAIPTAMSKPAVGEKPLRVLIVDDWTAMRRGLRMRLELESDLEIAGEANDGPTAIALATKLDPDLVLMDLEMPGMDGIEAAANLRTVAPETAVIILTLYDDAATRARAKEAGAVALVAKYEVEKQLLATVRHIRNSPQERKHPPMIEQQRARSKALRRKTRLRQFASLASAL